MAGYGGHALRLEAYRNQTAPLSSYYRSKGQLVVVSGMGPVDEVAQEISTGLYALHKKASRKPSIFHLASLSGPATDP